MRRKSVRKQKRRKSFKQRTKRKPKRKSKRKTMIYFESDYQNLRLRYLRAKKKYSREEKKELSYLESLLKSLQKKQNK